MSHYNYGIINGANESAPKLGAYGRFFDKAKLLVFIRTFIPKVRIL